MGPNTHFCSHAFYENFCKIQKKSAIHLSSRVISFSFINCGHILYSFWDIGHGNDNLDWSDLQMSFKVIKSGTNQKLVYAFLLAV